MSTIDAEDRFIIQRGTTTYQLPASEMSTIKEDDWLLIARGSDHFKVSGADVLAQLGDGGGGNEGASFKILQGPGEGTTVDLFDFDTYPDQTFVFETGTTYQLEFMHDFLCMWDLVGEGGHGGNGQASASQSTTPGSVGLGTVLQFPAWTADAGGGSGGFGGIGRDGGPGTGGYARITGTVPGQDGETAITVAYQGSGGGGGSKSGTPGQTRNSSYTAGGIFPVGSLGQGRGGSGQAWGDRDKEGGGGGGGGSAAVVRLSLCQMIKGSQCILQVGGDNAAAGIKYIRPGRAIAGVIYQARRARRLERRAQRRESLLDQAGVITGSDIDPLRQIRD